MSFSVEPSALERAASRLNDAVLDAQTAKEYILKHTDMVWHGQGLLNEVWPDHQRLINGLDKRLAHLMELLGKSRDALQETAGYYRRTDSGNAAQLDASFPTTDRTGYELPRGHRTGGNQP
ncbi:hypothetical protein [Micromonospora arida]|uniref:hypothetical protein n=1 Tax=Micromonospora arida TaxID=2203715 RepID=UPI003CEDC684